MEFHTLWKFDGGRRISGFEFFGIDAVMDDADPSLLGTGKAAALKICGCNSPRAAFEVEQRISCFDMQMGRVLPVGYRLKFWVKI